MYQPRCSNITSRLSIFNYYTYRTTSARVFISQKHTIYTPNKMKLNTNQKNNNFEITSKVFPLNHHSLVSKVPLVPVL